MGKAIQIYIIEWKLISLDEKYNNVFVLKLDGLIDSHTSTCA